MSDKFDVTDYLNGKFKKLNEEIPAGTKQDKQSSEGRGVDTTRDHLHDKTRGAIDPDVIKRIQNWDQDDDKPEPS